MNRLGILMNRFAMWCHHTFGYEWGEIVFVVCFLGTAAGAAAIVHILTH